MRERWGGEAVSHRLEHTCSNARLEPAEKGTSDAAPRGLPPPAPPVDSAAAARARSADSPVLRYPRLLFSSTISPRSRWSVPTCDLHSAPPQMSLRRAAAKSPVVVFAPRRLLVHSMHAGTQTTSEDMLGVHTGSLWATLAFHPPIKEEREAVSSSYGTTRFVVGKGEE